MKILSRALIIDEMTYLCYCKKYIAYLSKKAINYLSSTASNGLNKVISAQCLKDFGVYYMALGKKVVKWWIDTRYIG